MMKPRIIDSARLIVGEGPLWDEKKQILYVLDIRGRCVRTWNPETGEHQQFDYEQEIGCLALDEEGRLIAAMTKGIYYANPDGTLTPICEPESFKGRRFNDGKVGPDGRFYVGTTDYNHEGAFYRLDPDGTLVELLDHIGCSNGLAWSTDGKTLYYCDSPDRVLEAFDFDAETGSISNRRTIMPLPLEGGEFDGMTIDAEGMLWVAIWGEYCALRIDPLKAEVMEKLVFPVKRVSCCGFAGRDLNTLIITTAAYQTTPEEEPEAGCTYALEVPVPGLPTWRFATA